MTAPDPLAVIEETLRWLDGGDHVDDEDRGAKTRAALAALASLKREREERPPLTMPYCQVVGRNAIVLLRRDQIEMIAREFGMWPAVSVGAGISAEMRRALIELDSRARDEAEVAALDGEQERKWPKVTTSETDPNTANPSGQSDVRPLDGEQEENTNVG